MCMPALLIPLHSSACFHPQCYKTNIVCVPFRTFLVALPDGKRNEGKRQQRRRLGLGNGTEHGLRVAGLQCCGPVFLRQAGGSRHDRQQERVKQVVWSLAFSPAGQKLQHSRQAAHEMKVWKRSGYDLGAQVTRHPGDRL